MTILITGGHGFLGQRLAKELLQREEATNGDVSGDNDGASISARNVKILLLDMAQPENFQGLPGTESVVGDITNTALLEDLIDKHVTCIYHLAAVLSGGAEADYDSGMKVNVDGTRALLNACRKAGHRPRLIFTSSVAIFGRLPSSHSSGEERHKEPFTEDSTPVPQSSYGTQKAICELLIADASRRGYVDGVCLRLPTIAVRPGRPNSATSSFVSSIIREPLQHQPSVCPVDANVPLWIQSPRLVIRNLLHARTLDMEGQSRIVTIPGVTTTPAEMLEEVRQAGGDVSLVEWRKDALIHSIISSWPGAIETPRALKMGFAADMNIRSIITAFVEDDMNVYRL